jgi:hypothetical protein
MGGGRIIQHIVIFGSFEKSEYAPVTYQLGDWVSPTDGPDRCGTRGKSMTLPGIK